MRKSLAAVVLSLSLTILPFEVAAYNGEVSTIAFAGNNLFAVSGGRLYVRKLLRSGTHDGLPKSEKQG